MFPHCCSQSSLQIAIAKVAYIGKWPMKDWRGRDLDEVRRRRAGVPMSDKWACVEFRGDWTLRCIQHYFFKTHIVFFGGVCPQVGGFCLLNFSPLTGSFTLSSGG